MEKCGISSEETEPRALGAPNFTAQFKLHGEKWCACAAQTEVSPQLRMNRPRVPPHGATAPSHAVAPVDGLSRTQ
jgi:hypothetical protein